MLTNWTARLGLLIAIVFGLIVPAMSRAASVASEGFNYPTPGGINGKTGGTGFGANAWTFVTGMADPATGSGSMTYTDSSGNALQTVGNKLQPAANSRSTRNFSSAITTASQTYWVSFRINQTDTTALPTNHAGLSLFAGLDGSSTEIFLGKPSTATNYGIDHSGTMVQKAGSVTTADRNALLVYKLVFTATDVTISMWVNPVLNSGALGAAAVTLTKSHTTNIASLRVSTGANSVNYQFDEFRMGTTFDDVAPLTLVASDGFNYTVPGSLNGNIGGTGFGSNAWTVVAGQTNPALGTGSLTYTDTSGNALATAGNKIQPAVTSRSTRNLASTLIAANNTYWVGFRINQTDTGALPTNHAGFSLFSGTNGSGNEIFLGKPASATNWGMYGAVSNLTAQKSGSVTTSDRNAFLVYKLVFTSTQVTISMWVNPVLSEASLGTPAATLTASNTTDIASTRISTGANSVNYQFDEFRIGSTFDSVAPINPGYTHTPTTGAQLAAILNGTSTPALKLGDTIQLQAGTIYSISGGFVLHQLNTGSGYVTIQSSNISSLAVGKRVSPSDATNMPKIVSAGSNSPALYTAAVPEVAHDYKFLGVEFYNGGTQSELVTLILLGTNGSSQSSPSVTPYNFVFDRCYIHGQGMSPGTVQIRHGIMLNCNSTDITNSYIADILDNGAQSSGIGCISGGGPYLIDNNFLSASGENIIFGGDTSFNTGVTPTGITVTRNRFYKDPAWKGIWTRPCNHFELKCGKTVVVKNNIMENCWAGTDSQQGVSINLKCIQGGSGAGSSWWTTEDVTIENNVIHDVGMGIQLAGTKDATGAYSYGLPKNVTIHNNLIYNVDANAYAGNRGWCLYFNSGSPDVTVDHNTAFGTHMWLNPGDSNVPYDRCNITNNIFMKGVYGCLGGGLADGETSLDRYFPTAFVFQKNAIMGSSLSVYDPNYLAGWNLAPFSNPNLVVPSSWSTVLVNQATPGTDYSGWKVVGWNQATNYATYPYNNSGTDGKDIGCDIDALNTATAGCISGVWP